MNADTIIAIATPHGMGGIGVLRLSGPASRTIVEKLLGATPPELTARTAHFARLYDPRSGTGIDQCVVTWFPGPHSYTGEEVLEISCHGSMPVLHRLLEVTVSLGARPAERGEFTLRAVLNGRMDVSQAEAVNRLIHARTFMQAEEALRHLEGGVTELVHGIEEHLFELIARLEAEVDFAEENESYLRRDLLSKDMDRLDDELNGLVAGFSRADLLRDGAVIVLAGRPNAGKSTLFNALLRQERAIVDDRPGTTRDYIAESLELAGVPVRLVDTAGLRGEGEHIEIEGMRRSHGQMENADLVVLVTVSGEEWHEDEKGILAALAGRNKAGIIARNKVDLSADSQAGPETCPVIALSAKRGTGIDELREAMIAALGLDQLNSERGLIIEVRQQQLFRAAAERVAAARGVLLDGLPDEVVLEELNAAMAALGEITGRGGTEEILSRIFSSFCIGK